MINRGQELVALGGRVVVVTGAASGIGRATACLVAELGATVVAGDRDGDGLSRLADEARQLDRDVRVVEVDVASHDSVAALIAVARDAGRIQGVVNSAGIAPYSPALEISPESWQRVLDVNLTGTYAVCRAAAEAIRDHGHGGSMVNISSSASEFGSRDLAHYSAAKAGVVALTKTLAREWGEFGVRVNAVGPGAIDTPLYWASARTNTNVATLPIARIGQPDDVARAAVFFLSEMSSWITGQYLLVNGGSYMR
jgi:NAD(P)-dependent dehydrogenase (short-subunit alcohol dehydrogenase family)